MQRHLTIIISLLLLITSCTPSRMIKEKENSILLSEHGYLLLDFNYHKYISYWWCKIIINDEIYFYGAFGNHYFDPNDKKIHNKDDFEYKFPVPVGDIKISYSLRAESGQTDVYGTSQYSEINSIRILNLNIKENETIKLKLSDSKDLEKTVTAINGAPIFPILPWRGTFQEVIFEVEKSK